MSVNAILRRSLTLSFRKIQMKAWSVKPSESEESGKHVEIKRTSEAISKLVNDEVKMPLLMLGRYRKK